MYILVQTRKVKNIILARLHKRFKCKRLRNISIYYDETYVEHIDGASTLYFPYKLAKTIMNEYHDVIINKIEEMGDDYYSNEDIKYCEVKFSMYIGRSNMMLYWHKGRPLLKQNICIDLWYKAIWDKARQHTYRDLISFPIYNRSSPELKAKAFDVTRHIVTYMLVQQ
ncbi:MAG: hypothetical protein QXQ68_05890 [Candidatus Nitrosocaldaceae archaeon]